MAKKASLELRTQFINGLKEYNLTTDDMIGWYYCGGRNGRDPRHLNYFKMKCPNDDLPDLTDRCICYHKIKENCYITNGDEILILGNCCIKKFLPEENSGRTCEICKKPHKNRKNNRCNDCRVGLCNECGSPSGDYKTCAKCFFKN